MPIIRATVVLNKRSKEARDAARNVWHFATGAVPVDNFIPVVGEALEKFYDGIAPYMSPAILTGQPAGSGTIVEMATVTFGGAGAGDDQVSELFATRTMDIPINISSLALPSEAAVAMSFRGHVQGIAEEEGVTRPRSRRRGRVFLGPLNTTTVLTNAVDKKPEVHSNFTGAIQLAYLEFLARLDLTPTARAQHVVYSPTNGAVYPVTLVHVDNQFDTIRSRGERGTARMEIPVTQPVIQ